MDDNAIMFRKFVTLVAIGSVVFLLEKPAAWATEKLGSEFWGIALVVIPAVLVVYFFLGWFFGLFRK